MKQEQKKSKASLRQDAASNKCGELLIFAVFWLLVTDSKFSQQNCYLWSF